MCLLFLSLPFAVLLNGGPVALEMQSDDENDNDSKGIVDYFEIQEDTLQQ